ncbi:MAG: hypothetical protein ACFFG0_17710 [Candidatus Thorarchaeota archaeon]
MVLEKINESASHVEDDSAFNKWRKETVEDFLDHVYNYFDRHEVMTEKEQKSLAKGTKQIKLIGILRLYTQESMEKLKLEINNSNQ